MTKEPWVSDPFEPLHAQLRDLPVFFVGGMPRSGTTWVQQLLNAHPELLCIGESRFVDDLIPLLYKAMKQYGQSRFDPPRFWGPAARPPMPEHTGPVFRSAFAALAGANIGDKDPARLVAIGEKTPENISAVQRIWQVFPSSRFIHIIRDPRDGAVSGFDRFRARLPDDLSREAYVTEYCRNWAGRILAVREFADGRDEYFEMFYEHLHTDAPAEATKLFTCLGASTDPATVAAALEAASFEKLSGGRKQGEEEAGAHYRKGVVGGWREVMTEAEIEIARREAGELMAEMGYL